ncbi:MAG: orotate phosphoribosyltransferase [Gemmatimonadaceae bacterium]
MMLVSARRGHFQLESGHHSELWLDLDALFASPRRVEPFVAALADMIRPFAPAVVCGPLVGGAFVAQLVARVLDTDFCFTERMPREEDGLYQTRYRLPAAFVDRVHGRRVAIVDDVMSAGSALRGSYDDLQTHRALPVAAGALLVLGTVGTEFFRARQLPVVAVARDKFSLWLPGDCPLCREGLPVEDVAAKSETMI